MEPPCPISSTWIIIGVLVVLVVWIIMIYNGLVAMRQRVNQSFADIDVQLKQRHDLIPNLVETVKGYAGHERGTLEAVVKARKAAIAAPERRAEGRGREHALAARCASCSRCRRPIRTSRPTRTSSSCRANSPTSRTSSRPRGASSTTPCRNTIPASSTSRPSLFAGPSRLPPSRPFFDLGETRAQLDQAPQVKF